MNLFAALYLPCGFDALLRFVRKLTKAEPDPYLYAAERTRRTDQNSILVWLNEED